MPHLSGTDVNPDFRIVQVATVFATSLRMNPNRQKTVNKASHCFLIMIVIPRYDYSWRRRCTGYAGVHTYVYPTRRFENPVQFLR